MSAPSMTGNPQRSSSIRSGSISAQTPRPSQATGSRTNSSLRLTHARLTSLLRRRSGPPPASTRAARVWAHGPLALVRGHLVGEHAEPAADETGDAVGMSAGAPAFHQRADLEDGVEARSSSSPEGQPVHTVGQRRPGRARRGHIDRRPAPPCTARRRPSRPVGRRQEAAARSRRHRALRRRGGRPSRPRGALQRPVGKPRRPRSRRGERRGYGRDRLPRARRPNAGREPSAASTTMGPSGRVTVSSMVPGFCAVPTDRNQSAPKRATRATWASVSTFCTNVGRPPTPRSRMVVNPTKDGTASPAAGNCIHDGRLLTGDERVR